MASYRIHTANVAETGRIAEKLAGKVKPGFIVALDGDLGAGKTTFSQALAKAIGVTDVVNSPTFTIIKEYEGAELAFYHMDVYRISMIEADELGLDDYFFGDGLTVVEWASRIEPLMPRERLEIYIEYLNDSERLFVITPHGMDYEDWCRSLI